jgi:hypothetical protein
MAARQPPPRLPRRLRPRVSGLSDLACVRACVRACFRCCLWLCVCCGGWSWIGRAFRCREWVTLCAYLVISRRLGHGV